MTPELKLLTADEVAAILSIRPKSVYALAKRGDLTCVAIGKLRRFRVEDVRAFVMGHRREGEAA